MMPASDRVVRRLNGQLHVLVPSAAYPEHDTVWIVKDTSNNRNILYLNTT